MSFKIAYFKFKALPEEIRKANSIRSKHRLDCILFNDEETGSYKGLDFLLNKKKMLFFYKTPARDFVSADSLRIAEWSLTNKSLNVSSLYHEDLDYQEYAYGYPNSSEKLSNGSDNPFYPYRHDGYLFIMNKDITELEMLIIPDARNLIKTYYQLLIDGELDDDITWLRQYAKSFYDYSNSSGLL